MADLIHLQLGACAELILDNPPLNVVTTELTRQLHEALLAVSDSPDVRALVIYGAGQKAFCAGSDIAEFESLHGRVGEGKLLAEKAVYRELARLKIPTIAAIEGHALGGGLELAMCCDLRVASARSKLGLPELRLGVIPGSGGTQRLPRLVGAARAKEMILLSKIIDAETALAYGLVTTVVADDEAVAEARELASELAQRAPVAISEVKQLIDGAMEAPLDCGLAAELDASERVFSTQDMLEGARAFLAKRSPVFRGQ
ncbi:MAG TPA: enoyl-CoA hydratase-related protein [Mycobacterium sp.]|nr:enoyl-CoA hydratase-related protein [Mycobacterium sp.]